MLLHESLANAVHRLGRLLERAVDVPLEVAAVVPQPVLALETAAALDLQHQHAEPGRDDQEVDLAFHLPTVAGDVQRMETVQSGCASSAASRSKTSLSPSLGVSGSIVGGIMCMALTNPSG